MQVAERLRSRDGQSRSAGGVKRDIPGLTSVRGLAALWVVLFHFWYWHQFSSPHLLVSFLAQGYLGVDLFFVLSGYVIALNYADALASPSFASWGGFLWKRIARIYPLHLFMLLLYAAVAAGTLLFSTRGIEPHTYDRGYFVANLFLVQNWGFTSIQEWNKPAWSVSVEWLAYLVFPAMLWLAHRPLQNRQACWLMAFASLAILGATMSYLLTRQSADDITRLGPLRGLLEFWAGACVFHARRGGGTMLTVASLAAVLATIAVLFGLRVFFGLNSYAVVPGAFLVLVWALSFPEGLLARIMSNHLIMYLGVTSYSIYMVHIFILERMDALLGRGSVRGYRLLLFVSLTIALSYLLYRFVERPARRALREVDLQGAPSGLRPGHTNLGPILWPGKATLNEDASRTETTRSVRSRT